MSVTEKSEQVPAPQKCLLCDYDLRGHELPCQCPECGYKPDPVRDREETVAWYCSRRSLFISHPPPAFLRYLDDARCAKRGMSRFLLWYLLPWVPILLYGVLLSGVGVTHTFERWVTDPNQPGVRVDPDRYSISRQFYVDSETWDFTVPYTHTGTTYWWRTPNPSKSLLWFVAGCFLWSLLSAGLACQMFNDATRFVSRGGRGPFPKPGLAACSWFVIPHSIFVVGVVLGMTAEVVLMHWRNASVTGAWLGVAAYFLFSILFAMRFALRCRPLVRNRCWAYPIFWILPYLIPPLFIGFLALSAC